MENSNPQIASRYKYYSIGLIVVLLLIVTSWLVWKGRVGVFSGASLTSSSSYDYVIPGVPPINMFNHQGGLSYISTGDTPSSTISVLEYWNPGENNFVDISSYFSTEKGLLNGETIRGFLEKSYGGKYTYKSEHLSIAELKKYINAEVKTPLLFFFPLDKNQSEEVGFHPLTILIGIKESEQKVVMHNVYLGNNYEMSFADFEKSWERMRPDERNTYYVIQPVELKAKLTEIKSRKMNAYPERIGVMDIYGDFLANYAISRAMDYTGNSYLAMDYALKAKDDSRFQDEVHPFYKMGIYYFITHYYLKKGDLESAKQFALLSVETDHKLNESFGGWPGVDIRSNKNNNISEFSDPYRILGDVYLQTNEFDLAKQNYEKALEIKPDNFEALTNLNLANAKLNANK